VLARLNHHAIGNAPQPKTICAKLFAISKSRPRGKSGLARSYRIHRHINDGNRDYGCMRRANPQRDDVRDESWHELPNKAATETRGEYLTTLAFADIDSHAAFRPVSINAQKSPGSGQSDPSLKQSERDALSSVVNDKERRRVTRNRERLRTVSRKRPASSRHGRLKTRDLSTSGLESTWMRNIPHHALNGLHPCCNIASALGYRIKLAATAPDWIGT